jgi:hypothetical protein
MPQRKRDVRVTRVLRSRPKTGEPARLRALTVEMDFADARLTLSRATGLERQLGQWRLARALKPLQL